MLPQARYQHESLEPAHFRLLVLFPGSPSSPIQCSLISANLLDFDDISGTGSSDIKTYEAVSYVWGDSNDTADIECDNARLPITISLEAALLRFRDNNKPRVLWADAICINQIDQVEKAQQVSLMGLIYWKARRVLVWLGPDTETDRRWCASRAVETIQEIRRIYDDPKSIRTAMFSLKSYSVEVVEDTNDAHRWEAVRRLLDRKWFRRVWVVQELGLARSAIFYCGDASFDGDYLEKMLVVLTAKAPMLATFYGLNLRMLELGFSYTYSTRGNYRLELGADPKMAESFINILEMARGLECSDTRDTVYAFLGHPAAFKQQHLDVVPYEWYPRNLYNGTPTVVYPDYDEGNTAEDVYFRLAYILIVEWGIGLDLLTHVHHDQETIQDGYPSWVPRWNIAGPCRWTGSRHFRSSASLEIPQTSIRLTLDNEDGYAGLRLKATCLGTVYFALNFPEASRFTITPDHSTQYLDQLSEPNPDNPVEAAYSCLEELGQPFQNYVLDDISVFASTLTAGVTKDDDSFTEPVQNNPASHVQNFHAYRCAKAQISLYTKHINECCRCKDTPYEQLQASAEHYLRDLQDAAPYRAFFGTRDGRIGLGPAVLLGGDQVWLPFGAKMPFILRPYEGGCFRVLGQTYLHGVMRGEAVSQLTEHDFQTVILF